MQFNGTLKYKMMVFSGMFMLSICAADDDELRALEAPEQPVDMNREGNDRVEVPIRVRSCMMCCVGGCCGCLSKSLATQLSDTSYYRAKSFERGFLFGLQCTEYLLEKPAIVQKINEGCRIASRLLHGKTD